MVLVQTGTQVCTYGIDRYDGLKLLVGLRQVNLKLEAAS